MSTLFPKQKVSSAEKNKITQGNSIADWKKQNADYFISICSYSGSGIFYNSSSDGMNVIGNYQTKDLLAKLYKVAEGELDIDLYRYVLNPYNTDDDSIKNYPSKLRNYDIISPVIRLLLGEKSKRPTNPEVIVTNADSKQVFQDQLNRQVEGILQQTFINELKNLGVDVESEEQPVPKVKEFVKSFSDNYNDNRAIVGQEAIDYLYFNLDIKEKEQGLFYDWLVAGQAFTYKEVYRDDVKYEEVSPLELYYPENYGNAFLEDLDWCVRAKKWTVSSVIDRFRSELKDEEVDYIESYKNDASTVITSTADSGEFLPYSEGDIDVYHVCWKSFREIKILTYIDILTGEEKEIEVDESYKLNKDNGDINIETEWINEVRDIWRIGGEDGIYIGGDPIPVQRDELNNSSICKLPYNGRIGYTKNTGLNSVVKIGLNYQMLYNIYHYRFELTMAKNKDKVMLMPMGLIPSKFGDDPITKFLHYIESTGLAFFDETKPNAAAVLSALKSIDLGLGSYAEKMIGFMTAVKEEWWDTIGLNRQRYGDISQSAGKGTTEQSIFRSAIITEPIFNRFDKLIEKDLQGLLDYSKAAWINGKKGMYINSESRKAFLDVDGVQHMESEYRVFVKNGTEQSDKLKMLQSVIQPYAQKGIVKPNVVAEMIDANNFSKLKTLLKNADDIEEELRQAEAQKDRDAQLNIEHLTNEREAANRELELYKVNLDYDKAIDVATIQNEGNNEGVETKTDKGKSSVDFLKAKQSTDKSISDNENRRLKERDMMLKEKKMENDRLIAKMNKNKYDK